jgi:prevent-host-death family protein
MHEAKTNFSKLVELALQGEEVIIARSGTPLVKLVPVEGPNALRPMGLDHQEVGEDFLEESLRPLEEDEVEAFYRPDLLNG